MLNCDDIIFSCQSILKESTLSLRNELSKNKDIFSVYAIGIMTLVVSLSQLAVSCSQIRSIEKKTQYDELSTLPIIEIKRVSNESGDFIEVINNGGYGSSFSGEIFTFLNVQANVKPIPTSTMFFVPYTFSRPLQPQEIKNNVVLISKSDIDFKLRQKSEFDFAEKMTTEGYPSAVHYTSFINIKYRDVFGKSYERYYSILSPGLPAYESEKIKELVDEIYIKQKYPIISQSEISFDYARDWIVGEYTTNK